MILVVLGLGFVIFIHELGHFLLAKWAGVKVEMFSIGFGPTLVSWRKGFGLRFGSSAKDYHGARRRPRGTRILPGRITARPNTRSAPCRWAAS